MAFEDGEALELREIQKLHGHTDHVWGLDDVTSFDWSLRQKSTILMQFTAIDSLLVLLPSIAADGATDFSGLQVIDLNAGVISEHMNWENSTSSCSTVQAIDSSKEFPFTSFESGRRNSNFILVYDLMCDLRPVSKIAHNEIYGEELDSAVPSMKLMWLSSHNLLMLFGSHNDPIGVLGNIKLWDVRSGRTTWELEEKEDCFADVSLWLLRMQRCFFSLFLAYPLIHHEPPLLCNLFG